MKASASPLLAASTPCRTTSTFGCDIARWRREWQGTTALILWTQGRRSGESKPTPLIYQRFGDDLLVVASKGDHDSHPAWYLNLDSDPIPRCRSRRIASALTLVTATAEERLEMWQRMTAAWPRYDEYQKKTDREIPVVVLERASG